MPAPPSSLRLTVKSHGIRLADLAGLAADLAKRIEATGFSPELVVYVETGARLFAHELAAVMGLPMTPIWVRRGGHGLKERLAPWVVRLPIGVRDGLRWLEEWSGVQRLTRRRAVLPVGPSLAGRRILLIDDAADTGRTIRAARGLILAAGVRAADLRSAVIAATMPRGRLSVDFYLLDKNHRMPWSADSDEKSEAERLASNLLSNTDAPRDI